MEPRIIPCQLPPGLEIAIPPGHDLPPQQPLGTYQRKPLPPLPPLRPGFSRQISAFSVASMTTRNSSRSRSRARTTPSPAPSGAETVERLENETSTILIQHSPTPISRRSSEHRSCSPQSHRNEPEPEPELEEEMMRMGRRMSTPIMSPCTLHRSSVKIKQITGLDLNGYTPTRPARSPVFRNMLTPVTPDNNSSVYSSEVPPSTSEPSRTLSMIDDHDDESEVESDWDFSPSSRRNYASWIPASPVPPRVEILDFDEASPRRRDSEIGPLRSPGMHHFETLPARRNNHMEVSYVGAKDLYHATATSIANSTQKKGTPSRASAESGRESILPPKSRMSFAAKVLQSGRKRPPTGINTASESPSALGETSAGKQPPRSARPYMHAHSLDDDRLRVKYSDTLSRVFRWSGEHRRAVSDGASPVGPLSSEPRSAASATSASASVPESPAANRLARRSMQGFAAQVRRKASSMGLNKDEQRRENLRQSIRVIPEGSPL
ncbi:hypothetical protein CCHL11_01766 [Colletotrichum chlorophyti]|uniref:Uncharacterized protein n=1 Tax=Colletotrichum chlorophyti TaxID=708187 RepID=A0A1Q8RWC6_9PEZI|nr:hypothetical protein CCHL11_01766 [Colletotrichum chlorophyti]